ncbi:hypothetical protein HK097_004237, partial [Rhizophlyctis rosea]
MDADSEKIREKRLAKLAALSRSQPASGENSAPSSTSSPASHPATPEPTARAIATGPSPMEVDYPKQIPPKAVTPKPASSPAPVKTTSQTSLPNPSPKASPPAPNKALQKFKEQSEEDWEDEALSFVFACTLNSSSTNPTQKYLPSVVEELSSESLPPKITSQTLERILYARLSLPSNSDPNSEPLFDYLVGAWKRTRTVVARITGFVEKAKGDEGVREKAGRRKEVVEGVRGLVLNYAGLVVNPEMADSFPQPRSVAELGPAYIAQKVLLSNVDEVEGALPQAFLEEFVARFERDGLDEIVGPIMNSLAANMRAQSITKEYQIPIRALMKLVSFKPIASTLPTLKNWNPPNIPAKTIEVLSILGPFFGRPTIFPDADPAIADTYFASSNPLAWGEGTGHEGIGARNPGDVKSAWGSLRGIMETIQNNLKTIVEAIIRAGPESREGVIQYIAGVIKANKARGRMQVDPNEVSTDGFIFNVLRVCLKLCDPIMDTNMTRLQLVDPDWFVYANRLDVSEDTKINSDKESYESYVNDWKSQNPSHKEPNFVSDVFYLTLALHHYGFLSTIRNYTTLTKEADELRKAVKRMQQDRDAGRWEGAAGGMQEIMFKRFQGQLDKVVAFRLAMETVVFDPVGLEHSLRFWG